MNFSFLVLLMLVISVVQPRGEAYQQKYSEDVDITPWKLAKPVGALIIVLIAMMYVGFAWQFGITPGEQLAAEYEQLHPAAAVAVE